MEIADADARVVAAETSGVVVQLRWRFQSCTEDHWRYQALRMRHGLVYDIQDYREERSARRALR